MSVAPHDGLLCVDKPAEWTSHDVVGRMRRLAGTRRVGHAGTLDPMATGLLLLGVGQGTRLLTFMVGLDKTYTATIRLGQATTTDDAEGELLGTAIDATGVTDPSLQAVLETLRGDIAQVPSTVSAIKVDGRRAYARARAGEDVQLAARDVHIEAFEVLRRRDAAPWTDLDVRVTCSSGTYVRALARDLGSTLGVGGHLTALRRTRVGPFEVEDAVTLPPRGNDDHEITLRGLGDAAAAIMPTVRLSAEEAIDLGHGKRPRVPGAGAPTERAAALDERGALVAVVEVGADEQLRPQIVIPPEART